MLDCTLVQSEMLWAGESRFWTSVPALLQPVMSATLIIYSQDLHAICLDEITTCVW